MRRWQSAVRAGGGASQSRGAVGGLRALSSTVSSSSGGGALDGARMADGGQDRVVTVGDVSVTYRLPEQPWLVPSGYDRAFGSAVSQHALGHLRWMLQKDSIGQDMFFLGSPGPARRHLAMRFAEITQREVEYLAISRDTTESDLKQRREIIDGTAVFSDQAPVRAALHGRLLILDGIEKAERNVLPTINNLLENREMQLDDGRFLMGWRRYDELKESGVGNLDASFVRAHPDFRVIALGLPVPPFKGKPLDPPLRSRFQCRVVEPVGPSDAWSDIVAAVGQFDPTLDLNSRAGERLKALASAGTALRSMEESWAPNSDPSAERVVAHGMPHFPESTLPTTGVLAHMFPSEDLTPLMARTFPLLGNFPITKNQESLRNSCKMFVEHGHEAEFTSAGSGIETNYELVAIQAQKEGVASFTFQPTTASDASENQVTLEGTVGRHLDSLPGSATISPLDIRTSALYTIDRHKALLTAMAQDHCVGRDVLITGDAGSGKSRLAEAFANVLGYETQLFSLYKDMSARDLLQRRSTDNLGNTGWEDSPLISAAVNGDMLILDGIDRVDAETLTVIQRLVQDREADLFDGRLLRSTSNGENTVAVHPAFRVVALATTGATKADSNWMTSELLSMFSTHHLERLQPAEQEIIVRSMLPNVPSEFLSTLREFSNALLAAPQLSRKSNRKGMQGTTGNDNSSSRAASLGVKPLSTRQVMRLCRFANAFPERAMDEFRERLRNLMLGHFLPNSQKAGLEKLMDEAGVPRDGDKAGEPDEVVDIELSEGSVRIGDVSMTVSEPKNPELVPSPLFFDIARHKLVMRDMLEDVVCDEKFLLLIGNQGVGKNKMADRLLELLQREREYVQLHRDSTVGSLTLSPTLRNGIIAWEDSPLVRAVTYGRTLMIDEVDKAPLEVVSVLKGIIEDGEMLLADGRRLVSQERFDASTNRDKLVPIHPQFSILALANRPGWPFQGNSFFADIGDIFSSHVISNPDAASELELVEAYAPSVDREVLRKLVLAFKDLRELVLDGVLVYPYSVRECVAIAKHLEAFPNDGLVSTVENVLGFDSYDPNMMDVIVNVFQRRGVPLLARGGQLSGQPLTVAVAESEQLLPSIATEEWTSKPSR